MRINHSYVWLRQKGKWIVAIFIVLAAFVPGRVQAAGSDFTVQVAPSPLVITVTPGKRQSATLTIRNSSNHPETLYPKLSGFTTDTSSKDIRLTDSPPAGVQEWVLFRDPSVIIPAGGTKNLDVIFNTPGTVGFSYSLAILLSRKPDNPVQGDGVRLQGAVAVFCLINVDRPDAKRQLAITGFSSDKSRYQYLPASFKIAVANNGNVIDAPKGTLFIQRSFDSNTPIAAIPLNPANNYVLPDVTRAYEAVWNNGFPLYTTGADGKRHVAWDWKKIGDLRFGRYVAKVVLTYNDGKRDIPLVASYTFWVIPWALILVLLLVVTVLAMGIFGWGRLLFKGTKKVHGYAHRK